MWHECQQPSSYVGACSIKFTNIRMSMCPFIQAFVEKNTLIPTGYNTDEKTHTQYEKISHVLSMFFNSGTSFATTSIPFTLYARFQTSEQSLCGHKDPIVHLTCNNQSNTCFPYTGFSDGSANRYQNLDCVPTSHRHIAKTHTSHRCV